MLLNRKTEIYWLWNPRLWEIGRTPRFNSGDPYVSYHFGPIWIRRWGWKV